MSLNESHTNKLYIVAEICVYPGTHYYAVPVYLCMHACMHTCMYMYTGVVHSGIIHVESVGRVGQ